MQNHQLIFNNRNTNNSVNQLPVALMKPIDQILNSLSIASISHFTVNEFTDLMFYFDENLQVEMKQIFYFLSKYEYSLCKLIYKSDAKTLNLVLKKSKSKLN